MSSTDDSFRNLLEQLSQEAGRSYDRTLIALSGGALAVTFGVADKLLVASEAGSRFWLLGAWVFWWAALLTILASFLTSMKAMQKAIDEFDDGLDLDRYGDPWDSITRWLNYFAALFFVVGGMLMSVFVFQVMLPLSN